MMQERTRQWILLSLSLAGLAAAGLAGLAEHVHWLEAMCSSLSDGCRETTRFLALSLPIWVWGVAFYLVLAVVVLRFKEWQTWLIGAAVGIEGTLIWVMVSMRLFCIFCAVNAAAVLLLAVFAFRRERFWQMLSVSLSLFLVSMILIPRNNNELLASSPTKSATPIVVATVAGDAVTREELERPLATSIYNLEMNIYQLKKQRLDQLISEKLLQKEAAAKGVTVQQLLDDTALAEGVHVEESEVDRYYDENRARLSQWQGSELELRSRIKAYLEQQKSYKMVMDYSASLGAKYGVNVLLKEPLRPLAQIDTQSNAAQGPPDAPVTIIEFSDYQCPACRGAHENVLKVRETYAGKLRWIFRDYPLQRHKDAEIAAEAARCAREQNKFWEYQNVLYASNEELTPERLEEYAGKLGMDGNVFKACLDSRKYREKIQEEVEEAKKVGVDRTPTFLINGKLVTGGLSFDRFKELIDAELAQGGVKTQ